MMGAMKPTASSTDGSGVATARALRIGCVSFLNAVPLIDGLGEAEGDGNLHLRFAVPSELLAGLEAGADDIALCPVIDYFTSGAELEIVPVGAIGCGRSTMTVKLVSRVPIEGIDRVHADTDSHTSVVLLQVVLAERFGLRPRIVSQRMGRGDRLPDHPEAMLVIGDKVVRVDESRFPHQLDLGEAWNDLTGLPFVFAIWMARRGAELGGLPGRLEARRRANLADLEAIVRRQAPGHRWPVDLARHYLGSLLTYEVGPAQIEAIGQFARKAHALRLIDDLRPLKLYRGSGVEGRG
ncbi:MAG: hypothetical protein CMJ18_16725 [Phycisphaeraceae bacterium]|nr:hypothetical protein [Phycisphaeraceae bacterium]